MGNDIYEVLIIEDNQIDRMIIDALLKKEKVFQTKLVQSLKDGIDDLKNYTFDVILLDLNLPDETGQATFNRIQEFSRNQPIVVLSANVDKNLSMELIKNGAQNVLSKGNIVTYTVTLAETLLNSIKSKKAKTLNNGGRRPVGLAS